VFGFIDDRSSVFEVSGLALSDATDALVALCDAGVVALTKPSP